MCAKRSGKKLFVVWCIINLMVEGTSEFTAANISQVNETYYNETEFNFTSILRTERSHEGADPIILEPRARPMAGTSDRPEDPHFHPIFDDSEAEKNVTYQLGKTAHLHCRIRQLGNRVVSWVRQVDLHILTVGTYTYTTDQRFTSIHKDSTDDWTLEIRELRRMDAGVYECQISNEPKLSLAITLNVIVVEARIAEGPSLYVKTGDSVNLTCMVTDIVGTRFVFWYHDKNSVKKSNGIRVSTDIGPTTVSRLYIPAAKATDSGNYTCAPSYAESATITLDVLIDEKPAAMQHGPNQACAIEASVALIIIVALSLFFKY
ncbi:hypothetical protein JTE90_002564 [Oedothorax gibbosus]|uniref:Ig-like domain-containing protein n=1 Tax=Oedothorax gibbosus TaxID=931172 RepID=A0AAV6V286_9ARAC|nr:hypothetical protein JTE90_002564 [Oedothorax gibbosus]